MNMDYFKNKQFILIVGVALIIILIIISCVASLNAAQDSMIKVVKTEHNEILKFNLLREHSGTTFYQSGAVSLTEEECGRESIPYSAVHAGHFSKELRNLKSTNEFYRDEKDRLVFLGELYEWETENYDDAAKLDISLDRSESSLVPADRGYILVKFYTSEDHFDATESSLLIRSIVNEKRVIIKVLSDFYYSDRKSYRVIMENYDDQNTHVLILADNVDESYIVNLIEYFAGVDGCVL